MQRRKRQQALWVIILVLSLGASIALALTSPKVTLPSVITYPVESHSLVLRDDTVYTTLFSPYPPDQGRLLVVNKVQYPRLSVSRWHITWIIIQVAAVGMGIALLVSKGLGPASIGRRLDLGFAYLGMAWFSLVVFKIKIAYESMPSLIGGTRFSWFPARLEPYSLNNIAFTLFDGWSLMIIGLGIAIGLVYMWLRWSREGMPEKVFP